MNDKIVSYSIDWHRRILGFSQTELSAKAGVSASTISRWENGKCFPTVMNLRKLAEIFGCSVDAIYLPAAE